MNKHFNIMMVLALSCAIILSAAAQQGQGKGQDKKQEVKGKGNQKGKKGEGNQGNDNAVNKGNKGNNQDKDNRGKNDDKTNKGNSGNDNNGRGNDKASVKNNNGVFIWTPKTFRDRKQLRKGEKVTLCHKVGKESGGVTINVSEHALQAHLNHGDVRGECPNNGSNKYSDRFLKRRADYYNQLQNSNEEILYSRSILDYARSRLSGAQTQLVQMKSRNTQDDEIQRKQVVITELEQNVSVLEQLLGVATTLVVNRLNQ